MRTTTSRGGGGGGGGGRTALWISDKSYLARGTTAVACDGDGGGSGRRGRRRGKKKRVYNRPNIIINFGF